MALISTLAKSCGNTMTMTSFSVLRIFKANNEEVLYLPYLWSVDWMAGLLVGWMVVRLFCNIKGKILLKAQSNTKLQV